VKDKPLFRIFIPPVRNFPSQTCTVLYIDIFRRVDDGVEIATTSFTKTLIKFKEDI